MEMAHFASHTSGTGGATLEVIPNYSRTHSGLTLKPITAGTQSAFTGPRAIYSFYTFGSTSNAKLSVYLPPSFNVDPGAPFKFAVSLNGATPATVSPIPSYTLGSMPNDWKDSVINRARVANVNLGKVEKGKHELSL